MSFILDALKKSENDRQRQTGPALFEVRVAPPKSKFPLLAVSIISLLVVNLGVVAWLMFRKPAVAAVPPQAGAPAATVAPTGTQPPTSTQPWPAGAAAGTPPPPAAPPTADGTFPPPTGGAQAQASGGTQPQASYSQQAYGAAPPPPANAYSQQGTQAPGAYPAQRAQEPVLADESGGNQPLNPDDYEPARDAPAPGSGRGRVVQSTDSGLPTYEEAATHQTIPSLHMDLHSYAPEPAKRFVLINMKRLYEGQSMSDGVKVESITNDGAIMSYNGTRFVLDSE